ncbi:F-box/FBD/LRR-repeat protein At5g56420 [Linum perenne]
MTTKKKKTKQMKKKPSSPTVDRISQLPDEIIHLILQNLDSYKSVARTSILSRRWGQLWRSYPVVEVDVDHYRKRINLKKLADATSKRFRGIPLLLDSFIIRLWNTPHSREDLHQLLSSVSVLPTDDCGGGGSNRSPLKVVVKYKGSVDGGMYFNCSRTKFLHLRGCDLSGLHNLKICLDNLQELCLQKVRVSEQSFPSCLAKAPRLEKLILIRIKGIRSLDISASNFPSLKSLFVRGQPSNGLQHAQLTSVPLLETLHVQDNKCKLVTVDSPVSAPFLKSVVLTLPCGDQLDELISKLSSLESVYLDVGYIRDGTGGIRISAHMLRKLTITQWYSKMKIEIEIDAPNLVFLFIRTQGLPVNINVVNVASNCRSVVHCNVCEYSLTTSWFIELRKCLEALATRFRQLVFKLSFHQSTAVSMIDWTQLESESSPLVVQHLQLGINLPIGPTRLKRTPNKAIFFDVLLSTFHPKMLYLARRPRSHHNISLFSYISKQVERKNLQDCCSNKKCWRHQFKDAKITSVTVDDFLTTDKSLISQPSINMIFHFE